MLLDYDFYTVSQLQTFKDANVCLHVQSHKSGHTSGIHCMCLHPLQVVMLLCTLVHRFPWWLGGKESTCQCRRCAFDPWVGKILWRKKWHPTPVFLPEKCHGQRSLAGYSPWGNKESDTTERLNMQAGCAYRIQYFYFLPVHLMTAPACQLLHCTPVLSKVLYDLKCFSLFLCLFLKYYLCGEYYKPITAPHHIADFSWSPRLTLLDF